ncbi:prophage ps3 protein 01 [Lawsonella clevelandensis]|uniref:Panacea domain-containing protein n=1 Tax=Lawsonella clevelandensis TaxID=1528099 RepID=UPI0006B4552F|nr:type II toxin-antitoxin system antitoxin SocA domain-containing protein [Lawsonella clevelandensis]ALE34657.1 prophage ps3 protein 01 [Lawsonella clevelandensis]
MASIFDVAEFILSRRGEMTTMKLQKLCYYSQAWNLVWDEKELFPQRFEAWANGPVSPELYGRHRGEFRVRAGHFPGDPEALTESERQTVESVIAHYGPKSAVELSEMTHRERPWLDARGDSPSGEPSTELIPIASIAEYYGSLV